MRAILKPIPMRRILGFRLFLCLFLVSLVIYSKSLNGDFLFDDKSLIVGNEDITHLNNIPLLFTSNTFKFSFPDFESRYNYYRPISSLFYAIVYRVSGLNPAGYHLTNIIVHSLNALLVFYLIYKLFANYGLALLTSLLFCVHPLHTESVSYISGLAELLVSLFVLLAAVYYINYTESRKAVKYFVSLFCFVLALLSREAGFLIFIPFFILVIGLKSKLPRISVFANFFSFIGILLIYIKLRLTILVPIQSVPNSPFPFLIDILNFLAILAQYVKLLILPNALHIFRSIAPISLIKPAGIIYPVLLMFFLLIVSIVSIKKKKYVLFFGICWFILGLMHLIRFMYKFRSRITMEEHWVYLACVGFFVILSYLVLCIRKRQLVLALSSLLVACYAALTFINASHWKDELHFYRYNLKLIEPSLSIVPRLNFTRALYERKLYKEAIEQVNAILIIAPRNLHAYIELGDIYRAMKKYAEAKQAYENALKIDYFCWQANRRLKLIAEETGQEFIDEIDPRLSAIEAEIISFIRLGEFDKAFDKLKKVLISSPSPQLYTLSGITFGKMGLYRQAIEEFNSALKIDPNYYQALYNLAVIYEKKLDTEKLAQIRKKMIEVNQR